MFKHLEHDDEIKLGAQGKRLYRTRYNLNMKGMASNFRRGFVAFYPEHPPAAPFEGSKHQPPEAPFVSEEIEQLCDYVNDHWPTGSAVHLAAYVLWKLNWIHPFADGNGRTARAMMYVVLSVKLDSLLPGAPTIPEQIAGNKNPYYEALEAADQRLTVDGKVDVSQLEKMLDAMLSTQLLSAAREATGEVAKPDNQILH